MKRSYRKLGFAALFVASLVVITLLLHLDQPQQDSLHNLYYVPILLAAAFLGETGCVIIAMLAIIGSGYAEYGHMPHGWHAWWVLIVRGAFFLTLGYLVANLTDRMRAHTRSWQSLLGISRAINSSLDLDLTLQTITRESVELTSADACAIRLISDDGEELIYAKSFGLSDSYMAKGPLRIHENPLALRVIKQCEVVIRDVRRAKELLYREETLREGIVSVLSVPLHCGSEPLGLMNLYRKRFIGFTQRDLRIASAFAEQAAMAIFNAHLYASIQQNYLETVRALTQAIEAKDPVTLGHSERVAVLAVSMARVIKLTPEEIQALEFGALLHDIGKISFDDVMLSTPSEYLSADDRLMLEMHPMIGKSILNPIEFLHPSIPIVLYHHEQWNGAGYPEGLVGEQTPLLARIVAVANGYDHASHRSLLKESPDAGLACVRDGAGTRFDAQLVEVLETVLQPPEQDALSEDAPLPSSASEASPTT